LPLQGTRGGYAVAIDGNTMVLSALAAYDRFGQSLPKQACVYDSSLDCSGVVTILELNSSGEWVTLKQLKSGFTNDLFGYSVVLQGDTLVIGAPEDGVQYVNGRKESTGAVYIHQRNEGGTNNWGLVKKISATSPFLGSVSRFGWSIALDGDTLVAGAYNDS
jgi:FG-GAP repeat